MMLMIPAATAHEIGNHGSVAGRPDCAPVESLNQPLPDGSLRPTSRVGTTWIPAPFPRQESRDNQNAYLHGAVLSLRWYGARLRLFAPPVKFS